MDTFNKLPGIIALYVVVAISSPATAYAEVVVVVPAKSPVVALTRQQIPDIFLGRTNRYPDGHPAVPVDQTEGSPARDEFYARYAGKTPAQLKAHWAKIIFTGRGQPPREAANGLDVRKWLIEHPDGIGYLDRGQADGSVRILPAP